MSNLEFLGCQFLKDGSGIHIKKKNRGKFTASAKKAGESVQEHKDGAKVHKPYGHNLDMVVGNGWMASNKKEMHKKHRSGDGVKRNLTGGRVKRVNWKNLSKDPEYVKTNVILYNYGLV